MFTTELFWKLFLSIQTFQAAVRRDELLHPRCSTGSCRRVQEVQVTHLSCYRRPKLKEKCGALKKKSSNESWSKWHHNLATILGLNSQTMNPAGAWHLNNTHWRLDSRQVPDARTKKRVLMILWLGNFRPRLFLWPVAPHKLMFLFTSAGFSDQPTKVKFADNPYFSFKHLSWVGTAS